VGGAEQETGAGGRHITAPGDGDGRRGGVGPAELAAHRRQRRFRPQGAEVRAHGQADKVAPRHLAPRAVQQAPDTLVPDKAADPCRMDLGRPGGDDGRRLDHQGLPQVQTRRRRLA
jgi:hypothetical protein